MKQTPSVTIRTAEPKDAPGIVSVQSETWLATFPDAEHGVTRKAVQARLDKRTVAEKVAQWQKLAYDPKMLTLVAVAGDQVVGYCNVSHGPDSDRIGALYVIPAYQSHGLGFQMMQEALEWLGDNRDIWLEVVEYNHRAIAFYERLGFVPEGKADDDLLPEIKMVRKGQQ